MKEIIESNKPEQYFMELTRKKCDGKRLNQRDRFFIEIYLNNTIQRNHPFSPKIMNFGERKRELCLMGFIITKTKDEYKNRERYTAYTLDKHHVEVEKKNLYEKAFDRIMGFF